MRAAAALILAVNIGVLLWQVYEQSMGKAETPAAPSGEATLKLLHEPMTQVMAEAAAPMAPAPEAAMPAPTAPAPQAAMPAPAPVAPSPAPAAEMPAPAAVAEAPAMVPVAPEPVAPAEPAAPPPPPAVCYALGPLPPSEAYDELVFTLRKMGADVDSRLKGEITKLGYWVYLPPERSTALARLKVEELRNKGIKDIARVKHSEPRNAISLGVFRYKATAEKRLAEIRAMGYSPRLEMRYNDKRKAWLTLKFPGYKVPEENDWQQLLKGFPKIAPEEQPCP